MRRLSGAALLFSVGLLASALIPTPVEAQTIRGTVVEAETGEPLSGVRVWLLTEDGAELGLVMTEADGRFRLQPDDPGTYRIRATRIGYLSGASERVEVGEDEVVEVEVVLHPDPVRLPGIEVEVERLPSYEIQRATYTGLYMRRSDPRWATPGGNRVFVRGDLEPHTGMTVWEFIERYAPANIQRQLRHERQYRARESMLRRVGQSISRGGGRECPFPSFLIRGLDLGRPTGELPITVEIYLDMPLREIEGIEFYRQSHHAPLELRPSGDTSFRACGVIVIWPRQAEGIR
jgi:hypothetical protein